jgi:hypothetical protein
MCVLVIYIFYMKYKIGEYHNTIYNYRYYKRRRKYIQIKIGVYPNTSPRTQKYRPDTIPNGKQQN